MRMMDTQSNSTQAQSNFLRNTPDFLLREIPRNTIIYFFYFVIDRTV